MKKVIVLLLSLVLLAPVICSCAPDATVSDGNSETNVSEANVSGTESEAVSAPEVSEAPVDRTIDRTGTKVLVSEGCTYTASGAPHATYTDDGTKLTDGILGSEVGWGWSGAVSVFTLDLGEKKNGLADFDILMRGDSWGIVLGDTAEYYISDDGKNWSLIGTVTGDGITKQKADGEWVSYSYLLELEESVEARYVRYKVYGGGANGAWAHELCVWSYEKKTDITLHEFKGTESFTNLTMTNKTATSMGDRDDAPAYCVYSKMGFSKASMTVELSEVDLSIYTSDGVGSVCAYIFLGVNVCDDNGNWMNCCDAGLSYGNDTNGWHLFWATATDENGTRGWFDTSKTIDPHGVYTLVLDTSEKDETGRISILSADGEVVDSLEFHLYGSKADGTNTSYLTDIALDWSNEEMKLDSNGQKTDDWKEITLSNYGKGIHMNNVRLYDCKLYSEGVARDWTNALTDCRGIWSDATCGLDIETTRIYNAIENIEYIIDLDLG